MCFDHFVWLALKGLKEIVYQKFLENFIRQLTIIILQANARRAETLVKGLEGLPLICVSFLDIMFPIFFMKHLKIGFSFSLASSIKLVTHLEWHDTNYSLLKKKCCRHCTFAFYNMSKLGVQLVLQVLRVVLRGTARCYGVLHSTGY